MNLLELVADARRAASRVRLIAQISIVLKKANDQEGLFSTIVRKLLIGWSGKRERSFLRELEQANLSKQMSSAATELRLLL